MKELKRISHQFATAIVGIVLVLSPCANAQEDPPATDTQPTALAKRFSQEMEAFGESLEKEAKTVYDKYRLTEPFPNQDKLLVGRWYGAAEDPDYKTYWRYQRAADGSVVNKTINLDLVSMEYTRKKEESLWRTQGRVLYEYCENKTDDSEALNVFLLDSVGKDAIQYRMVFTDEIAKDWVTDIDRAGAGPPIQLPEDYEELVD